MIIIEIKVFKNACCLVPVIVEPAPTGPKKRHRRSTSCPADIQVNNNAAFLRLVPFTATRMLIHRHIRPLTATHILVAGRIRILPAIPVHTCTLANIIYTNSVFPFQFDIFLERKYRYRLISGMLLEKTP
jgi:hypothetical protein